MRKGVIISFILVVFLTIVSAAYAHSPNQEHGLYNSSFTHTEREIERKIHRETLPLKEQLIARRLKIQQELRKHTHHRESIMKLHKERIADRTMNQKKFAHAGIDCGKKGIRINDVRNNSVFSTRCQRML
jgi:hypothetical protein